MPSSFLPAGRPWVLRDIATTPSWKPTHHFTDGETEVWGVEGAR